MFLDFKKFFAAVGKPMPIITSGEGPSNMSARSPKRSARQPRSRSVRQPRSRSARQPRSRSAHPPRSRAGRTPPRNKTPPRSRKREEPSSSDASDCIRYSDKAWKDLIRDVRLARDLLDILKKDRDMREAQKKRAQIKR